MPPLPQAWTLNALILEMFSPASIRKGGCNERLRTRPGQPSGNVPAIPMTGWAVLNGVLSLHDTLLTVFLPLWILTATEPRTQRWPSPSSLMPGPGSHPPSPCIEADGHCGRCGPRRPACRARSGLHVPRYGGHVLLIGPGHPGGSAGRLYGAEAGRNPASRWALATVRGDRAGTRARGLPGRVAVGHEVHARGGARVVDPVSGQPRSGRVARTRRRVFWRGSDGPGRRFAGRGSRWPARRWTRCGIGWRGVGHRRAAPA